MLISMFQLAEDSHVSPERIRINTILANLGVQVQFSKIYRNALMLFPFHTNILILFGQYETHVCRRSSP